MKTEEKQLVREWLDKFAIQREKYSHCDFKEALNQFKKDNNLLTDVSGWYLNDEYPKFCIYFDYEKGIYYGISNIGRWVRGDEKININPNAYLATQQQVEERLFPFFEKLGYVKGVKIEVVGQDSRKYTHTLRGDMLISCENTIAMYINVNSSIYVNIMKDGILAEIIQEKPNENPNAKAIKAIEESIRILTENKKELER